MMVGLRPGDELVIFKESTICKVSYVCKACGHVAREYEKPKSCPRCGVAPAWKCDSCGKLHEVTEDVRLFSCTECGKQCRKIKPIEGRPIPWEDVWYFVGIKGKFLQKFNSRRSIIS